MRIDFLTIFPGLISGVLEYSLLNQAHKKGLLDFHVHDLRDYTHDRHRTVDDVAYGGGPGMVFRPEPLFEAVDAIRQTGVRLILPSPQGEVFTSAIAEELAGNDQLIFLCGRYEGIDERVRLELVDRELSIGDFVTMGGELPSLLMTETIVRYIPGVIGDEESVMLDSFQQSLLDYPHYTRPSEYRGLRVPDVLLSGNHEQIRIWRRKMMLRRTLERRPDLLQKAQLTKEDEKLLAEIKKEGATGQKMKVEDPVNSNIK
ncbi:MAG TPA: tRNA (guanosine(37)-N1)-methyltransferase TrmD [Acidobacteriota bacterium]|nr:tRNA (guanosine(37)-N1)-methyltransferase TrmD [Acidobacteriota bacterium]